MRFEFRVLPEIYGQPNTILSDLVGVVTGELDSPLPLFYKKLEIQNSENNYPDGRTRRKPIRGDRSEGTPFSRFVPRADPASLPEEPPRRTLADPRLGPPGLSLGLTL